MAAHAIGILGASGYTGAELVRLLHRHPSAEIVFLTANRHADRDMSDVFPHLGGLGLPKLRRLDDVDAAGVDIVFCALPHGTTQRTVATVLNARRDARVVDLSADFRLKSAADYQAWYGKPHEAPALQREAVYGLTELNREQIRDARLVANPGCYATAAQLPLAPLARAGLIDVDRIVVDAKSGVTGAGREPRQSALHAEVSEGIHAYSAGGHRHVAEIEQTLNEGRDTPARVTFTPHLMPMNRGILATCHLTLADGASPADLRACLHDTYRDEPFMQVLPLESLPSTRDVRGANQCRLGVVTDRVPGRAIVVAALDNLVKGASGQAVQNMNVMLGLPETAGLEQLPLFP